MLGFPEKKPMNVVSQFYGREFKERFPWPFRCVADGEVITRGGHHFACLVLPGHSIGHSCLYESRRGVLIAGDQITAGVQFLLDRANPLADHFQSLARLREMDVKLTLPGHGSPFRNHIKRIDSLLIHHRGRLEAAYAVLKKRGEEGIDAYEVTLALDGMLSDRDPIDTLPPVMKFIHTRHTFAYLLQLTAQGCARKDHCHGRVVFYPC
jgi:glyoxylase-like metal-dependent hydrolase (beta-lactamase superfamily II)